MLALTSQRSGRTRGCKASQVRQSSVSVGASSRSKEAVLVLDNEGKNVTPLPLYHAGPGGMPSKPGTLFLDEVFSSSGSDHSVSTSSSSFKSVSRLSSLSHKSSQTSQTEASPIPKQTPVSCEEASKIDTVKQHVTEENLDEVVDIWLTETDTISLLHIPSTLMSQDADDAEAFSEKNSYHVELCKSRLGNDKYVEQETQTFSGAPRNKQIQCDNIVMVDKGTVATVWDIYDSFCNQSETQESVKLSYALLSTVYTSNDQEKRGEKSSGCRSINTGSNITSLLETETFCNNANAAPDPKKLLLSESFQYSLKIMEKSIVANIFHPKFAAYKCLPIIQDPHNTVKPDNEEQCKEDEKSSLTPTLEHFWAFSCEITKGHNITSMTWNKKNPDLLAVGYGDFGSRNPTPGFICCWSLKSPTWPERIFHCHSSVTSLDFSANNPNQLAVGMFDGTVAIYNVQCQDSRACRARCLLKHLQPVWQVIWTKQEMILAGKERAENLVSVSAGGRITKWLLFSNNLCSTDLMELSSFQNIEKEAAVKKKRKQTSNAFSEKDSCLCIDFHPTNYGMCLVGTWNGLIHMRSLSDQYKILDTYQEHIFPVNHIESSPFSPDVFLSCSSDWTIKLWKQGHSAPVLSFTSTQKAVYTAKWSPNWPTVFAALNGQQLEIWDLNTDIMSPTILHSSGPGVTMTALLFAKGTDCVLVGDSDGQVTVYKLKNLNVGKGNQVDNLEDIINSRL